MVETVREQDPRKVPYGAHRARMDLAQALPLSTPLSLLIDPSNACNFRCTFCPTADSALLASVGRPKGVMKAELFDKIVEDLAGFDRPIKSIHLYKDGEPFVNKRVPAMVAALKRRKVALYVETTTNGGLLTPDLAEALVDAGLDGIRISVYGPNADGYARVTRVPAYDTVLANVRHLHRCKTARDAALHIHCKIIDVGFSEAEKREFQDAFAPISDSLYIHPLHGQSLSTGEFQLAPDHSRKICSEPFIKMAINFNGAVSVCCADWSLDTVVGDATRQSLRDIWQGDRLHQFRLAHLEGRRHTLKACHNCAYVTTLPADNNLDHAADMLLARYAARG